jgi:hypothetical protein
MSSGYRNKYPNFYLTQTSVKDLEKDETCPARWKGQWLENLIRFPSNEDMDKGKYFEYLCLGGGATTDEVTDLPRMANGRKYIDQIRIEEQAENFKRFFDPASPDFQGHTIIDRQVLIHSDNAKGTIDFVTIDLEGKVWINDLKLTKDASSDRSKWGWGNDWRTLDWLQMQHYKDLYKTIEVEPNVGMWIFDYSPSKRVKFGEICISSNAIFDKEIRFNAAAEVIDMYEERGWSKLPSESECRNCTLHCDKRFKTGVIERIKISI